MSSTPLYDEGDVVYLKESAALGFLEPARISAIFKRNGQWLYTVKMGAGDPNPVAHYGDRIHMVRGSVVYFTEDEFVLLCDALDLAEANAQKQLDNIQSQKAILCATEPTSS
jgi:hypothetical protein